MMDRDLDDLQVPPGHLQDGLAIPGHGSDQPALLPLSTPGEGVCQLGKGQNTSECDLRSAVGSESAGPMM